MTPSKTFWLTTALAVSLFAGAAANASPSSGNGMNRYEISAKNQDTANSHIYPRQMGGDNNVQDQKAQVDEDFGSDLAKQGTPMLTDIIPSSSVKVKMETGAKKQAEADFPWKGKAATERLTAAAALVNQQIADKELVGKLSEPGRWVKPAQAAAQAQATNAGNAAAEVSRDQASSAIDFCAHYLHNFTVDGGNKWNLLRNNIFVPMGILLLLPGALLTQVRAIMAAGNPVLGNINPLEGIMRSVIAIFLIPGTYLVVNYSIDLSNSITFTINSEYFRLFGSDMYKDAICAEIRAFPVRGEQENRNALDLPVPAMTPLVNPGGLFAQFEGMMENKIEDPCSGLYQAPGGRADEAMSSSSVAARLGLNGSNAALTASWNILCAFQMAYLYYLWFVGPVAAGLWVWPMKQLRGALPSWVEGVITLAFWSLFWNTAILLIACFKGVGETGCVLMTALHFLATASVKHAFDFAGLVRAAGQEAANMAEKAMKSGGAGGGAGGGGGGGSCGAKGGGAEGGQAPATADGIGALSSNSTAHGGNVSVASNSPVAAGGDSRGFGSNGPVDKAGLNEALAMRSLGKGEGMGAPLGSSFDDKSSTDKSLDRLAESAMIPPSEKKFDGDVFSQESQYASMFCSAEIADQLADIPMDGVYDATADLDAEAAAQSTVANELSSLKAAEASGYDAAALAAETSPPPSELTAAMLAQDAKNAEDAKLAQDQAKHAGTEMALAQAGARAQEAADARRSELESKRAEKLAESISTHMSNLSMAAAGAEHGAPLAGASGSAGENGSHGSHGAYAAALSAELLRDDVAKFDFTNSLTDIDVDSTSLASSNMSSSWVSNESLTSADLSRIEFSDIDNMDVLASSGWVDALDAVDASSVVNNSLSANVDSSIVANPSLSAPAVGNVTQYGDVTTYGGVVPSDMIDRSDRSLVNASAYNSANSYNSANAYVANDSYSAPLVTNASAVPAISGTQVDANSVVSNAVYSAQAVSGNVVAAVENYNTIPTGAHASLGGQSTSNEYYAAPAVAASNSYVVDNAQSSANVQQGTPVFASVLPSSTPIDYSAPAQTITGGTQPASNAEYYSAQANPAPSMVSSTSSYAADYSSSNSAQAQYVADYSSSNSAQAQYVAQQNSSSEYAQTTQYAPVQGQPSSFIQPGAPANEYYAAPSQSAPLVAALITPNQPIAIDAGSVQAQEAYSSPVQYYLANASAHAESRSVENIAPVERTPVQQSSDVVYARSNSEAYTTVAPYQHVESTESRAVSFAPATAHNVQHGPQTVTQSEQSEAYLSQQQVYSKVQQANGLIGRMNTILAGFDAPHAGSNSNAATPAASTAGNAQVVARAENAEMNAQPVAQQPQAKKSLHDLLPVQRKAKTPPKEEMVVTPPPMSNSWFDA